MPSRRVPDAIQLIDVEDNRLVLDFPFLITEIQNLALPPVEHQTVRTLSQHGVTHIQTLAQQRPVNLVLHLVGDTPEMLYYRRRQMEFIVNPFLGAMKLRLLWGPGDYVELRNVYYDSGFDMGTNDLRGPRRQSAALKLVAYDPIWWGSTLHSTTKTATSGTYSTLFSCTNEGTFFSYPSITLTGPFSTFTLDFYDTAGRVKIEEPLLAAAHYYITLTPGSRTIVDDAGEFVPVSDDTTLALSYLTFHPAVTGGVNDLGLAFTGAAAGVTSMALAYYDRWLGIGRSLNQVT